MTRRPIGLSTPYREFNEVEKQSKVKQTLIAEAKKWVGLTDEELPVLAQDSEKVMSLEQTRRFYKRIEAKLKEKNT